MMDRPSASNYGEDQTLPAAFDSGQLNTQYQSYGQTWDTPVGQDPPSFDPAAFTHYQNDLAPLTTASNQWNPYLQSDTENIAGFGYFNNPNSIESGQDSYEYSFGTNVSSSHPNGSFPGYQTGGGAGQTVSPYQLENDPSGLVPIQPVKPKSRSTETPPSGRPQSVLHATPDSLEKFEQLPINRSTDDCFGLRDVEALVSNGTFTTVAAAPFAILGNFDIGIEAKKGKCSSTKRVKLSLEKQLMKQTSAPRRRGRPPKQPTESSVNSPEDSSSEGSEESDDDSDSSPSMPEEMIFEEVFPQSRPTNAIAAAKYDSAKALWRSHNINPTTEQFQESLKSFGSLMTGLKQKATDLQTAYREAAASKSRQTPSIKAQLDASRDVIDAAIWAAVQHGHNEVLLNLHTLSIILFQLREHLVARIGDDQPNWNSIKWTLELLSKPSDLSAKSASLKWPKLSAKIRKRGDQEVGRLLDIIDARANGVKPAPKLRKPSWEYDGDRVQATFTADKLPPLTASVKRLREDDQPTDSPNKKSTSTMISSSEASKKLPETQSRTKPNSNFSQPSKPKSTAPLKPLFFQNLQSAAKRIGSDGKNATVKLPVVGVKDPLQQGNTVPRGNDSKSSTQAAPKPPAFSFSAAMASINKTQEQVNSPPPALAGPPETEEEKKTRLRKEERRKLRVRFREKPDLEQIKFFTHEAGEEVSAGDDVARDVRNAASEGQALKRHLTVEDEDEDMSDAEEALGAWTALQAYDHARLDVVIGSSSNPARESNFTRTGGKNKADSPESIRNKEREATTLMAVYTRAADIPLTPQEPSRIQGDSIQGESVPFGRPSEQILRKEAVYKASLGPVPVTQAPSNSLYSNNFGPGFDLSQFLQTAAPPVQNTLSPMEALMNIVSKHKNPASSNGQHQMPAANLAANTTVNLLESLTKQSMGLNTVPAAPSYPTQTQQAQINWAIASLQAQNNQANLPQQNQPYDQAAQVPNRFDGSQDYGRVSSQYQNKNYQPLSAEYIEIANHNTENEVYEDL
ncbi:MAG: hypothetical protein M1814_002635 [Vezdaea aestivalis]|nr:MAG: hypothetical protein M1814_002635 [Vezdaea aestivalis]